MQGAPTQTPPRAPGVEEPSLSEPQSLASLALTQEKVLEQQHCSSVRARAPRDRRGPLRGHFIWTQVFRWKGKERGKRRCPPNRFRGVRHDLSFPPSSSLLGPVVASCSCCDLASCCPPPSLLADHTGFHSALDHVPSSCLGALPWLASPALRFPSSLAAFKALLEQSPRGSLPWWGSAVPPTPTTAALALGQCLVHKKTSNLLIGKTMEA